jgi:hypothetical protein
MQRSETAPAPDVDVSSTVDEETSNFRAPVLGGCRKAPQVSAPPHCIKAKLSQLRNHAQEGEEEPLEENF